MASLIKLKQIEGGTALGGASHSPASISSSAAPFSFDVGTQTGNIPTAPRVTVAGNTLTFIAGDGIPAVTYTPTIAADVFITSGAYNAATQSIVLVLNNGDNVTIPVADLIPVATAASTSATLTGNGTNASPLVANVLLAPGANALVSTPTGLSVAPAAASIFTQSESISVTGNGTAATPFQAAIKLQPDIAGAAPVLNLLHNPGALKEDTPGQKGLGYVIDIIEFVGGPGPFNVATVLTKYAGLWDGTPQIARVDGYVNGVLYSGSTNINGPWNYTNYAAVLWTGIVGVTDIFPLPAQNLFTLDVDDNVRFVVHVRAT